MRNLRGAKLDGQDLSGQDYRNTDLRGASLIGADLRNIALQGAYLQGANLSGADLTGADLTDADLTGVHTDDETRWPENFAGLPDRTPSGEKRSFAEQTLANYLPEGRLISIPMRQRAKLAVILTHLAEAFEPERRYTEKEVNAILGGFHEDFATLRRVMCDLRYMARQNGIYWRLRNVEAMRQEMEHIVQNNQS